MKPFVSSGWFCAIVCGIALTWSCAAIGYARVRLTSGCRSKVPAAILNVRAVEQALYQYQVEKDHCPTRADLLDQNHLHPRDLVDPWGTVIQYRCFEPGQADLQKVISAGPDRFFGTFDDITNER